MSQMHIEFGGTGAKQSRISNELELSPTPLIVKSQKGDCQSGLSCITLLDDNGIQSEFHFCPFHDSFLHSALRDKPEHMDLFLLSNTMGTILKTHNNTNKT